MKGEMVGAEYAIDIEFDDFRTFLKDFSANLALEGMLVEAAEPRAPGTEVALELSLADGHPLVEGHGVVAWSRTASGKAETAAMGIRFLGLNPISERLVRRIIEERTKAGLPLFDLDEEPAVGRDRASNGDAAGPRNETAVGAESDADEIQSLRAEIETLKREQTDQQKRWQAELEAAREAEVDLNSRLSDSLARVVTISESRDALADQFSFSEESHRQDRRRLEELEDERAKLERAVDEQKAEVARWTEEAVAANTARETLESRLRSLEGEIETERAKAETLASEVENAQAQLSVEKTAKESLEKDLDEGKAALEKLEAEAEATETALRESLEQARADLEESSAKAGEFENEVGSLRSELGETQEQSEALQTEMASIRTELKQQKSRHDETIAQAATQQKAAARAEELVERVRAEHASLHDGLIHALTALGEVTDPERPEVFIPPPQKADSDELPEARSAPGPSKRKRRFAGLAKRLLGDREPDETSDQFHAPAVEDTVSESESDDVKLAATEAAHANPRLPEHA